MTVRRAVYAPASIGSRPRFRTALSRLTAGRPRRDGSTGTRWWRVPVPPRPHRSCKDQLCTPRGGVQSQCRPDLPGISNRCFHWISFLDSSAKRAVLQMARTSGIEPLSMRGQRMALPIYQVRKFRRLLEDQPKGWWVTAELNRACAKAQALQARSVTRLGVTQMS